MSDFFYRNMWSSLAYVPYAWLMKIAYYAVCCWYWDFVHSDWPL